MIGSFYLDLILIDLGNLLADPSFTSDLKDRYFQLIRELKYLKFYRLCLDKWNSSPFGNHKNFGFFEEYHIDAALIKAEREFLKSKRNVSELLEKIQQCKPKIKEDCLNFLDCSFKCEVDIYEIQQFLCSISASLNNLLDLKANMILDVKVKIESLKDNLDLFKEVLEFTDHSSHEDLEDFKIHLQDWAHRAACLSLLYWVLDVKKENIMGVIPSDLQKKISPNIVDFMLENLLKDSSFTSDMEDQYFQLIHELKHLKIYTLCLAKSNDFGSVEESHIVSALEEAGRNYRLSKCGFKGFDAVASELLEKIEQCKPKIKKECLNCLGRSFECDFSINELPKLMRSISASLHSLLDLKADMLLDVKMKIESLQDNLDLFKEVLEFTSKRCSSHEDLTDFKIHIRAWAWKAACLSLLYWTLDVKKENMAPRMDLILSDLQKQITPSTPEVTRMYLAVLKASKPSVGDMDRKLVVKFFEFLKDNLRVDPEKDGIEMLFIDLIFLITLLMDRKVEMFTEGKSISTEADAVVNEVASLICSLSSGEIKGGIAEERNFLLHTFLEKANAIKVEVRKRYAYLFPDHSSCNFPKINALEFIDSLLGKLKEFRFHFPKHQIMMLHEELLSLKESNLEDFSILKLQNKHNDIKDLWTRIVNVAYNAERAVSSFMYMRKFLWHDILCLSDAIGEIKLIKGEMKRLQDQHMYDIHALNSETSSNSLLPLQANTSIEDKVFVGFKDEVGEILDRLKSRSEDLDIISIVGMPGLGKTTLAKKVYSDASIRRHFNKCAWCTISQTFCRKKILLDILGDIANCDDDLSNMEEEDLALKVYRSLKGQRYLIVMDDIWDVSVWYALKMSFPDDEKGSRIMFTSRNHNVVLEAKSRCSPFPLNPLSKEESWELLEKKLFDQDNCPPDFVQIGKQIATSCKGLPLTVVLVAGLLKENIGSLDWWKQVGETLNSLSAKEGCRDLLELSYKNLPEFLKPCFLYFGLFQEDEVIRVKKLILLWISEGFIQKHKIKSLEVVAEEYLMDLVAKSLVIVTKRSSAGGIKACSVHDLLRNFCITKGEEENFIKAAGRDADWYGAARYAHYRVTIQTNYWKTFVAHAPPPSSIHSLLYNHAWFVTVRSLTSPLFKFIRVLDLELISVHEFPEKLILLRYLAISCFGVFIPPSIKTLENLETLCLHPKRKFYSLPLTLWEMQKLRHVSGNVSIDHTFPYDIAPLENVQAFSVVNLDYKLAEMFFRMIPKVQELKCSFGSLDAHEGHHPIVKMDFLSHLESLSVNYKNEFICGILPSCAFCFPSTLKKLSLMNSGLPWSKISPVAKLPNLEVLKLYNGFNGDTWNVGDEEFLNLKCLVLRQLNFRELDTSDYSFPRLERLEVVGCHYFEEIPSRFESISTLKMIQVKGRCRSKLYSSVMDIQEEQIDSGNEHFEVCILREN